LELTEAFERMIADQLGNKQSKWRRNAKRRRGSSNVPRVLSDDASRIVLACGERQPGRLQDRKLARAIVRHSQQPPVYWVAKRLDGSDHFECLLESEHWNDPTFRSHTKIDPAQMDAAVCVDTFRDRWRTFLRDDDHLVVDLQGTAQLLSNCDAVLPPFTNFKSIRMDEAQDGEVLMEDVASGGERPLNRAQSRLAALSAKIKCVTRASDFQTVSE
jgi:hypothetical protein